VPSAAKNPGSFAMQDRHVVVLPVIKGEAALHAYLVERVDQTA